MDLKSQHPFWPIKEGLLATYPPLSEDLSCDVLVVGAGITGALIATELIHYGMDVVMLDRREIGHGSTSATTGLIQYEIDVPLIQLGKLIGRDNAERAYQLCLESIDILQHRASLSQFNASFERRKSMYAASSASDVKHLEEELQARRSIGIELNLICHDQAREQFSLEVPALLISEKAAVCNAFAMTHGLLKHCHERGVRIFDRTKATSFDSRCGRVTVQTNRDAVVTTKHVVFASGYEARDDLQEKIVDLKSTYAIVTQPFDHSELWVKDHIFWESARPYLYIRDTSDGRILVGGLDDPFRSPSRRDARIRQKAKKLLRQLEVIFPDEQLEVEYAWGGTFGETRDGLAYIGISAEKPWAHYALGFGGNGITFSMIAAQILADQLRGFKNKDAHLFRFER